MGTVHFGIDAATVGADARDAARREPADAEREKECLECERADAVSPILTRLCKVSRRLTLMAAGRRT